GGQHAVVEELLQRGDAGAELLALLVDAARQHLQVVAEPVAVGEQLLDLALGPEPGRLRAPPGLGLGLGPGAGGPLARLGERAVGLLLRLLDRGVRSALREHEGAPQRLVGLHDLGGRGRPAAELLELTLQLGEAGVRRLGPGLGLTNPLVELTDAHGDALDEVVDVARVVAATPRLSELGGVEHLRSQFHGRESNENSTQARRPGRRRARTGAALSRWPAAGSCRSGR